MATRKNASKKSSRAKFNFNIDEDDIKKSKKSGGKLTKSLGILTIVFLIIGIGVGIGAGFYLCRNDCFEIMGSDELTLTIGENYYDEGCKVISFGRDISNEVEIETDLIINQDGSFTGDDTKTYFILYKSNDLKYGKVFTVTKIRLITFVEAPEEDEIESANNSNNSNSETIQENDSAQTNNSLNNFTQSNNIIASGYINNNDVEIKNNYLSNTIKGGING